MTSCSRTMPSDECYVQVRLITKQKKYAVPEIPYSIPSGIKAESLGIMINDLLKENYGHEWKDVEFDYLINAEFLRFSLYEHLLMKDISTESTIDIEYVERYPTPDPEDSLNHDDWVSAVHCHKEWILSGSYDNTLHIWKTDGVHKSTIPGHCGPIKGVKWVEVSDSNATFASVSHDQTLMLWKMDLTSYAITCIHIGRGHERSIECIDVDKNSSFLATGGWDSMLKIWAATPERNTSFEANDGEIDENFSNSSKPTTRTPLMTLPGHKEAISSIVWIENNEIFSSSWDHTIKLWDAELGGLKSEIIGNKSFFSISYSTVNRTLITASADRHIRLYDTRSQEGSIVKTTFTSHLGWVSTVCWSPSHEYLFISGGHDGVLKLWDTRSSKAPLYDMTGHSGKILCSDWTNPELMISGATDNTLKIFKTRA